MGREGIWFGSDKVEEMMCADTLPFLQIITTLSARIYFNVSAAISLFKKKNQFKYK